MTLEKVQKEMRLQIELLNASLKDSNLREKDIVDHSQQYREEVLALKEQLREERAKAREEAKKIACEARQKARETMKFGKLDMLQSS